MAAKGEPDQDRWAWWVFVFPNLLLGAVLGGARGAFIGGLVGLALLMTYVVVDHVRYLRRKNAPIPVDDREEARDADVEDADTMAPETP